VYYLREELHFISPRSNLKRMTHTNWERSTDRRRTAEWLQSGGDVIAKSRRGLLQEGDAWLKARGFTIKGGKERKKQPENS
jgi:hypothetical protein